MKSERNGAAWLLPFHDWVSAAPDLRRGEWDDAVAAFDTGLERARETGTGWTSLAVGSRARLLVHRGQLDLARRGLDEFERSVLPAQFGLDYVGLAGLAADEADAVARCRSTPSEQVWRTENEPITERAAQLWRQARDRGGLLWMLEIGPYLVRMGDKSLREDIAAELAGADLSENQWLPQIGALLLGVAQQDHAMVGRAATRLAELGLPLEAAFAAEEAGLLAARHGDTVSANRELLAATNTYTRLGASTDLDRLRARANRLGVRSRGAGPRPSRVSGWEALTGTERTVAGLVQQGMTNPSIAGALYLSPRTVQTHVSHILQKTNLKSRVDIATSFPG